MNSCPEDKASRKAHHCLSIILTIGLSNVAYIDGAGSVRCNSTSQ